MENIVFLNEHEVHINMKMKTNRNILTYCILICLSVSVLVIGTISDAFAKDRVYSGRVINADTKEPIEGAIVVAYWLEATKTLAGDDTRLKDVKETLTDKEGKWSIIGPEHEGRSFIRFILSFFGGYKTREPSFIVFKPGYCSWSSRSFGLDACKKLKPGGKGGFLEGKDTELPKLTNKEDRLKVMPSPVSGEGAWEKQNEFIKMINEERKNLGLKGTYH